MIRAALLGLLLSVPLWAQSRDFDVTPSGGWLDTGMDVNAGDTLHVTATGQLQYTNARQPNGPAGLPRAFTDVLRALAVNDAGRGALVGRIGSSEAARPFLVGELLNYAVPAPGRLFLAVNQSTLDQATGSYHVVVQLTAAARTAKSEVKVPAFPQSLIDSIPRRVIDADGNPGDRVNFVLIGSLDQVQAALKKAGWVTVDKTNKDAALGGLFASLSKQAYVTMPMSVLDLYGRPQDFGYAQADPLRVVASRHHFRLWKVPATLEGQTVWAGAGMHDIGFARDTRNNGITHKIDPNSDNERDYIRDSLMQTGLVVKTDYITAADPVLTAKTATGSEFTSDGRTLLVYLAAATGDLSATFADTFCSVLEQENPDTGSWGPCSQYLDSPGRKDLKLGPLSTKYRVLIVPGIMSSCVADTPAFKEGQDALKKVGLDVALLNIPNDSSESNAKVIAQYLRDHKSSDGTKYILVGYSKGGPDIQVALATEQGVSEQVAAFVTVAGASGGSPVADLLPQIADKYMKTVPIKSCQGDLSSGYKSLQRETRRAFLNAYPNPVVPTYSIIAKSDQNTTSKSLLQTWRILQSFGNAEDGQLLREDAIVPGAKFLGAALADHFAIALPFDKSTDSAIRSQMDKTAYPRAALLESLVRFVTADLETRTSQQIAQQ
ncbi:MAG TPA: LssY C-terminal domain-containing protein [Acidobacteriaceae bacterium]|nr:LssY C-terminal domain-containing protein [Acidobacteriaceae bacterium]